jgi:hypothetical protein
MVDSALEQTLLDQLRRLNAAQQQLVLDFRRRLADQAEPMASADDQPLTDAEIEAHMRVEPKTGAEIVARLGEGWEDQGITSGAEWVEALRRKQREARQW